MNDLKTALCRNPIFAALSAKDLDTLASAFSLDAHPEGHVYFKEGQGADGAHFLLEGEVAVTRKRLAGDEMNRLGAGEWFGLVALFDDKKRSATCTAATAVRSGWLASSAFQFLVNSATPAAFAVQRAVAAQLSHDFRHLQEDLRAELEKHG